MPLPPASPLPTEVLEVAPLCVQPGQEAAFEAALSKAQGIISSMRGYLGHELGRCVHYRTVHGAA